MKKILQIGLLVTGLLVPTSCKKYLTVEPQGMITQDQAFKSANDAITAINGMYSLMLPLADQIFIAGELRGDLVSDARGADQWIKEFTDNRVTAANPYCDYTKFYQLIAACNRALTGLDEILKIDPVNYNRTIYLDNKAEVYYTRAWAYLQLIKIWGDVPYVTSVITNPGDVSSLPVTSSDVILKNIITDAENNFATLQTINAAFLGQGTAFMTTIGQWRDLNSRCFLAELYLYNQDYTKTYQTMSPFFPLGNPLTINAQSGGLGELGMFYGQFSQWTTGFDRSNPTAYRFQVVMALNFDATKGQTNSLMKWTNNKYGGLYAVRPSTLAINNWRATPMSLQQYQTTSAGYYINETPSFGTNNTNSDEVYGADGYPIIGGYGDNYRAEHGSYMVDGKDTLICKYLMKSKQVFKNPLIGDQYADNDAFFNLYKDGGVYLMGCEAVNNMGLSSQALIYINGNTSSTTLKSTRYRVGAYPMKLDPASTLSPKAQVERLLLTENALETAFEGRRWFDLVRFAKRNNDPSLLANTVANKYPPAQRDAVRARLMDPKNWYLPVYKK